MKKTLKIVVIVGVVLSLLWVLKYFKDANASEIIDYETEKPFYTSIVKEVVATGKLNPEDEIELKPQVSGIIDKILVEEGDIVRRGDLIASIRVVPNEQASIKFLQRCSYHSKCYYIPWSIFSSTKKNRVTIILSCYI